MPQLRAYLSQLEWPWPSFTACLFYLHTGPLASLPVFLSATLSSTQGQSSTTAPLTWPMAVPSSPTGGGQPGDLASLSVFSTKADKKIMAKEYVDMYEHLPCWQLLMASHPNRTFAKYIVPAIEQGFQIGFNHCSELVGCQHNMGSARMHPSVARRYMRRWHWQRNS